VACLDECKLGCWLCVQNGDTKMCVPEKLQGDDWAARERKAYAGRRLEGKVEVEDAQAIIARHAPPPADAVPVDADNGTQAVPQYDTPIGRRLAAEAEYVTSSSLTVFRFAPVAGAMHSSRETINLDDERQRERHRKRRLGKAPSPLAHGPIVRALAYVADSIWGRPASHASWARRAWAQGLGRRLHVQYDPHVHENWREEPFAETEQTLNEEAQELAESAEAIFATAVIDLELMQARPPRHPHPDAAHPPARHPAPPVLRAHPATPPPAHPDLAQHAPRSRRAPAR